MSLVLPSGRPMPQFQPPVRPKVANPWAQYGLDPTQRQQSSVSGTADMARQGLGYAAQQQYGKQLSDDDWNRLTQNAQATGYKGGNVTGDDYNRALDFMGTMYGQPQPGQTPGTGGVDPMPAQPRPVVGAQQGIKEWQAQSPAAGVPPAFRGPQNPYAPQQQQLVGQMFGQQQSRQQPGNPYGGQQQDLMKRILANPQTMGPEQQAMLAEKQKESALRMGQQVQQQGQQALAGRGFGSGGGTQQALQGQVGSDVMRSILQGRRDVALQAAGQNREDELNALRASMGLQQQGFDQEMGYNQQAFGQGLDTLRASQGLQGQEFEQALQGYGANLQGSGQALNQMNANRGMNLNEFLGLNSADLDMMKFGEGQRQFDKGYGLDFLRYLAQKEQFGQTLGEQGRQFNANQGLNWAQLNAQQQQQLMNSVLGMF